jgi:hypothetical protein
VKIISVGDVSVRVLSHQTYQPENGWFCLRVYGYRIRNSNKFDLMTEDVYYFWFPPSTVLVTNEEKL